MPDIALFGTTRTVPAQGDTDWGENVSGILTDLIKAMDKMAYLVGDIPYLVMSKDEQEKDDLDTIDISVSPERGANRIEVTAVGDDPITLGADATNVIDDGQIDGQTLLVVGTSDTATIKLISSHQNITLNGDAVLGKGDAIFLMWDLPNSNWVELSRSN